jgi:hypothetical protein
MHHLGAHAAFADQHAALDQVLDGAAGGGAGDAEALGEVDLVLDAGADADLALLDQFLQAGGDLEVERHRAGPVHFDRTDLTSWRGQIERHGAPLGKFTALEFVMTKY